MRNIKKRFGLENLTRREKFDKTVAATVCGVVATVGGVWIMTGDNAIDPSAALANLTSGLREEPAAAAPYVPKEVDGVCTVTFDGEMESLSIQGNKEGYRWTAIVAPEDFTFEGTYVDANGVDQPCDYAFYQEQFEDREPQEVISQLNIVPDGGHLITDGVIWGEDRGELVNTLHTFSGVAVRTPELTEGANLGSDLTLIALAHNFECEDDTDLCIRWQAHIVAAYDKEVILPSEERPLA